MKLTLALLTLYSAAIAADATVYASVQGTTYHSSPTCPSLRRAKTLVRGPESKAVAVGLKAHKTCGKSAKSSNLAWGEQFANELAKPADKPQARKEIFPPAQVAPPKPVSVIVLGLA